MNRIGIDLGGTKIEGILIQSNGDVIHRERIRTESQQGYESIVQKIVTLIESIKEKSNDDVTVGVCTPGSISSVTGLLRNSNTVCLNGKPVKTDLESSLGTTVHMDNDANCFTLAESIQGAGKGFNTVFGVIMGTGVGGGIVRMRNLVQGASKIAGEWGHHKIRTDGPTCYCGHPGCVETAISGPALEREWKSRTGMDINLEDILTHTVHPAFDTWKQDFLTSFGRALSNVVNILDPDVIVLGGGVSNIPFLYTDGQDTVHRFIFSDHPSTPILHNKLGDSAGVYGAAYLGEWL